jgi:hypothetical protein
MLVEPQHYEWPRNRASFQRVCNAGQLQARARISPCPLKMRLYLILRGTSPPCGNEYVRMVIWISISFEPRLYRRLAFGRETSGNLVLLMHASGRIGDAPVI